MSRLLLALLIVGPGVGGCASNRIYERALPKRVEVLKDTGEAQRVMGATPLRDGSLEVWVAERRPVSVSRTVVYQTSEIRWEWNPLGELVELPVGLAWLLTSPIVLWMVWDLGDEPNIKSDRFWMLMSWVFAPINPFQSFFFPDVVRNPISEVEVFIDDPVVTEFAMSTPAEGVVVSYSFVSTEGVPGKERQATTDVFGRVLLGNIPHDAAWLRAESEGAELRYRLARSPQP